MSIEKFSISKLFEFLKARTCIIILSHKQNIIKQEEKIVFLVKRKISEGEIFNEMMKSYEAFKKIIETYLETVDNTTKVQ